jgi:uncharacterized heparinase superfamily protein
LQNPGAVLIADVGRVGPDFQPGHAHADTLSFELSLKDGESGPWRRIFVNSGVSCYGTSAERLRQRGTASHNTLGVAGHDSSEVWSGFRVARRARPVGLATAGGGTGKLWVRCGHDGYGRLGRPGEPPPVHWREWLLTDTGLAVRDRFTSRGRGIGVFYHLHPEASADLEAGEIRAGGLCIRFRTDGHAALKPSAYHPEFGMSVPTACLELRPARGRDCLVLAVSLPGTASCPGRR